MPPPQLPPTSVYPPSAATPGPGYAQNAGYTQSPGYTQNPGYPPNASYTPYQSYGYPYPMMPMPHELPKGMAITGMVLGIVGLATSIFYVGGVIGVIGLVFSIIAVRAAGRREAGGRGMAIAGLVTSIIAIIVNAIEIILIVWFVHTVTNCAQYNDPSNPDGGVTQYDQCVRQGVLGS